MKEMLITSVHDVFKFFPHSVQEVHEQSSKLITDARASLDALENIPATARTFNNTARAFDTIARDFSIVTAAIEVIKEVSPDEKIREACQKEILILKDFAVDAFNNKKLYHAFKDYVHGAAKKETLNEEQRYFLDETMRDFVREGLDLPDDKLEEVKKIKKELADLTLAFDTNISTDKSSITATLPELEGVDKEFMQNLHKNDSGNYTLHCDYPTRAEIMEHCTVEQTRKRFYFAFNNRAYPQNKELLEKIIAKRDQLARSLGFTSFAQLDIDAKMAETPERAEQFVIDLIQRSRSKALRELNAWKKDLPHGITLDENNKFKPWDTAFVKAQYKKKHFTIDEHEIAQYFEVQKTLQGVFDIYQKFLSLEFKMLKPEWAWYTDVQLIEVREQETKHLRGYIFIDLYPRPDKYSHACHAGIVPTIQLPTTKGMVKTPSMAVVIANFPKATSQRPALLKHSDVETFFHEFGHAMHFVLGSTELASFAGTAVKTDFVEMPSQIFEEWMFDKTLLKSLSSHYQTGKPLPDNLIENLVALKKFDSGMFVTGQCMYALVSLECFKEGAHKDTDELIQNLYEKYMPFARYEPDTHMQASFGHLTGYGAKYYGYMWSKVYALDLFYMVKEQGLVNPEAGKVFINKILAKGGSVDPNILLKDYLGRDPKQDAFFTDLGMFEERA